MSQFFSVFGFFSSIFNTTLPTILNLESLQDPRFQYHLLLCLKWVCKSPFCFLFPNIWINALMINRLPSSFLQYSGYLFWAIILLDQFVYNQLHLFVKIDWYWLFSHYFFLIYVMLNQLYNENFNHHNFLKLLNK